MKRLVALLGLGVVGCTSDPDPPPGPTELEDVTAYWLPINSLRLGAAGYEPDAGVCVGLVWTFGELAAADEPHCDDFADLYPYAVVRPPGANGCAEAWDYGPDADVVSLGGCIAPDLEGTVHAVDVTAEIASAAFTGTVRLATP